MHQVLLFWRCMYPDSIRTAAAALARVGALSLLFSGWGAMQAAGASFPRRPICCQSLGAFRRQSLAGKICIPAMTRSSGTAAEVYPLGWVSGRVE